MLVIGDGVHLLEEEYWENSLLSLGLRLLHKIRELRIHVPHTSKMWMKQDSFYLRIKDSIHNEQMIFLCLANLGLTRLSEADPHFLSEDDKGILWLIRLELQRQVSRRKDTKYHNLMRILSRGWSPTLTELPHLYDWFGFLLKKIMFQTSLHRENISLSLVSEILHGEERKFHSIEGIETKDQSSQILQKPESRHKRVRILPKFLLRDSCTLTFVTGNSFI
jgi:hypothetical protein